MTEDRISELRTDQQNLLNLNSREKNRLKIEERASGP